MIFEKIYVIGNTIAQISQIIDDIHSLCESLYPNTDDLKQFISSINEIVLNAIEHGNLELSYMDKSRLMDDGTYYAELDKRCNDERYSARKVHIALRHYEDRCEVTIRDDGDGFDWRILPDPRKQIFELHGRGIAIAKMYCDDLRFNERGNEVTLVKKKRSSH